MIKYLTKKYSLVWCFQTGMHYKRNGYANSRLFGNLIKQSIFQLGFLIASVK